MKQAGTLHKGQTSMNRVYNIGFEDNCTPCYKWKVLQSCA